MKSDTLLKVKVGRVLLFCFLCFNLSVAHAAIVRNDVLIIVNDNSVDSFQLGSYYAQQRNINPANIVHVKVPDSYFIGWNDFRSLRDQLISFMQLKTLDDPNLALATCVDGEPPYYCQASMDQLRAHTRIRYLVTTRGVPTRMLVTNSTLFSATAPTSVDNYLKYWLLNYFSNDVQLDFPQREIAFANGDGMRTVIPAIDRELIIGRIDGLSLAAAKAQLDRTIAAEQAGIYGSWYGSTKFWNWKNENTGLKIYPAQDSAFLGWRYALGQWREDRPECIVYLNSPDFLAPAHCRIKFNDDFDVTQGKNYPAPGNPQSREPMVVDALGYQGSLDGQATLGGFNALLNWRKNSQCSVTLCKDAADPVACRASSTDIFAELNTDCVGVAEGFMAYNHTSYPVSYLTIWPTGWRATGSGDVFQLAFPEVRTDIAGVDDNFSLWFRNTDQITNPLCYSGTDYTLAASVSCGDSRKLQMGQTVQPGQVILDTINPATYKVSLSYQTVGLDVATPLRVHMFVHETGAANTKIDYGIKTLATMAPGDSGWVPASINFTLDPALHTGTSYDRIELNFDTPVAFAGELGIDAVSLQEVGSGVELLINGSFAGGHSAVSLGDHAANFLNRLNGVAVWGSVGHHQSGGCAFCTNELEIMAYFLRGLPLGDAVWFDESNNSGILYGDPLYSPVAVYLKSPDRLAIKNGSVDLFGSTVNGRDLFQVATNYTVDVCLAADFYTCDQAQSWQATTISGTGGTENALLGTLDTTLLSANDFVIRLQVTSVNNLTGKTQVFADYYPVPFNHTPVAKASSLSLVEDAPVAKQGRLSATDIDNDVLTYSIVTPPALGTVVISNVNNGLYSYTPNANAAGSDSFTFKVNDGQLDSAAATVTVNIAPVNDAPLAVDSVQNVTEDTLANGVLVGSDIDSTNLTYSLVNNAGKGTVVITNISTGAFSYTPNANATGSDSFTFKLNDGLLDSNVATVSVSIAAVNDAPVAAAGTLSTSEDTTASGVLNGSDIDGDNLTYSVVSNAGKGAVMITNINTGTYTYTPNANANGSDSFTFKVNDGLLDSATATVTIMITAVNDAPVATAGTLNTDEDTTANGVLKGSDIDGDNLTYSVVSNATKGTVVITNASTGAYSYTPNANANGSDSFTFKVSDGLLDSNTASVSISIAAVNDAPVAMNINLNTLENTMANGSLNATDADGDALIYSVVLNAGKGTVMITDPSTGAFTYTPNLNVSGSDSFTFKVNDGQLDSNTATVTISITLVNVAPVANSGTLTTSEDTAATGILTASDGDSDPLIYSLVGNAGKGTVMITNISTGAYTYTPNANASGGDSFTFKVNDGLLDSGTATVTITITAVNDAPVATAGTLNTSEDTIANGVLIASDIDSTGLTYSVVSNATKGTVVITNASTGAYSYTPNANANGSDSFTFKASDGLLNSNVATVSVSIAAVNDAPVAMAATLNTNENVVVNGVLTASDIDGDNLTYSVVSNGTLGTVLLTNASTGAFRYTPNANASGSDSFTFKVNDGLLDSNTATLTVGITLVNVAPVAYDIFLNTFVNIPVNSLLNATDGDGDTLSYSIVSNASKGTVIITDFNTGAFLYTPNPGSVGVDSFTYSVNDGLVNSGIATVTVQVALVNFVPEVNDDSLTTDEDTDASGALNAFDSDGDTLTYSIVNNGTKGTATIINASTGAFRYTPNVNANGSDSFTFKVNDGLFDSGIATITVNILPVDDVPVASNINISVFNNTSLTGILKAVDVDGDELTFSLESNASKGSIVITDTVLGSYTYTPNPGETGTDSFVYRVSDSQANSATATITIQLKQTNTVKENSAVSGGGGLNMAFMLLLTLLPGLRFFFARRAKSTT